MKTFISIVFLGASLMLPAVSHAQTTSTPPVKQTTATSTPSDTGLLTFEDRKAKVYTDLTLLTTKLSDITTRLQDALSQLEDNGIDISPVTPLVENAESNLTKATGTLALLNPSSKVATDTSTPMPTAALSKKATISSEEDVKTTVQNIQTNLKDARQNLLDSLIALKAILSKTQSASTQ